MSRFDWYAASFRGAHGPLVGACLERFSAHVDEAGKGRNGFAFSLRLRADRGFHAFVQWGGSHGDLVHCAFTGGCAVDGAQVLRRVAPLHRVSRVDVAEDVGSAGGFQRLSDLSARVARAHRLRRVRIVPDDGLAGETIYLGSRSSPVFGRVYEKGKQVLAKGDHIEESELPAGVTRQEISEWSRVEIEVKPKHPMARSALASMSPDEVWGCSSWANQVREEMGHLPAPRFDVGVVWRAPEWERIMASLLTQYGRFLDQAAHDLGSWECLGLQLRDELVKLRRDRPRGSGGE